MLTAPTDEHYFSSLREQPPVSSISQSNPSWSRDELSLALDLSSFGRDVVQKINLSPLSRLRLGASDEPWTVAARYTAPMGSGISPLIGIWPSALAYSIGYRYWVIRPHIMFSVAPFSVKTSRYATEFTSTMAADVTIQTDEK